MAIRFCSSTFSGFIPLRRVTLWCCREWASSSELIPCFARRPLFGYRYVAYATVAIGVLGFVVWGHHMFVSSQSIYAGMIFSILSFLVSIPSAIKVFNWTFTLYKGSIRFQTPMLYALGFIGLFTVGGMTGLFLAAVAVDVHLHDTYFVIAHFHYIMVGGTVMAYLGGLHYWWPKISGRMYCEWLAKLSATTLFLGFNLTFFPQFILGYLGMPRRYPVYAPEFQTLNVLSTAVRLDSRGGLFFAAGISVVVIALRQKSARKSLAGDRARMDNQLASDTRQF